MKEDPGAKRTLTILLIVMLAALGFVIWLMSGGALNTPESVQP